MILPSGKWFKDIHTRAVFGALLDDRRLTQQLLDACSQALS
jgi:hypothetical protein